MSSLNSSRIPPSSKSPGFHRKCGCQCRAECNCCCTCKRHCSCFGSCGDKCVGTCAPARNLVVSIDGTANQFGHYNTHVIELHKHVLKDHRRQLSFYVSGIGTYGSASLRSYRRSLAIGLDLAFARTIERQVQDAYRWLVDHYQPGDKIFLFGFSRGAYQVRVLAGMIEKIGVVYTGNLRLIPFAYELYARQSNAKNSPEKLCEDFKQTFSWNTSVHFIGAWDTVASVGLVRGQPLPLTTTAGYICHFRHALALDERRVKFLPEYVAVDETKTGKSSKTVPKEEEALRERGDVKEVWFAGTHSDM
ncbi:hypothetical protein C8R43DRAFT_901668 [Mycena crocata]|nr:hypothetical protein C8R43DRAFT_901668 [Mycena crocata]